jgi:hypothetical protein
MEEIKVGKEKRIGGADDGCKKEETIVRLRVYLEGDACWHYSGTVQAAQQKGFAPKPSPAIPEGNVFDNRIF